MSLFSRTAVVAILACAGYSSAGEPGDARAEILRLDAEWSRVAAEGRDVDRIVSYWSDDATVLPPASPAVVGKRAIREFVAKSFKVPGFSISWKTNSVVVSRSGEIAYATSTNHLTFTGPDGKKVAVDGKAVTVWRKDMKGAWKCVVDIWNDTPTPAK